MSISEAQSDQVEPLVGRRMSFAKAFKAEIMEWRRLSKDDESLLRMFSACVAMRMRGQDPATLLPEER